MAEDLRGHARKTRRQLVFGFLAILFIIGDGLIYWFYGREAALLGLLCMLGGTLPAAGILVFLWLGKTILERHR